MKKFLFISLFVLTALCFTCGCAKSVDYLGYVSEKRTNIYMYSNDGLEIKIYLSEKETPYSADGIKGDVAPLTEIFVSLPKSYDEVNISVCKAQGEMSYRAVENCYYLSLADSGISGEKVDVTLTCGDESNTYSAQSVLYDGVMDCDGAVKCVIDHDEKLFESLTESNIFCGEIYVRLLYDEGCYYYVGVCDRDKKINAYLVDGVKGKIIAAKELNG